MRQFTTPEQTAKLIELGFEKPKSISGYYQRGPYEYDAETNTKIVVYDDTQYPMYAYSIGELIEILNRVDDEKLEICRDCGFWLVGTDLYYTTYRDLIDALYDMITLLKEKGVI